MGMQFINVTKPEEMTSGISKLEEAVNKFEAKLDKADKDEEYFHLVISGEYNRRVCDEIQKLYTKAGWDKVSCSTSSEKGERGGLTGLQLWRPKSVKIEIKIDNRDYYEYDRPELEERTKKRLIQINEIGMIELGNGQFGIEGVISGLYIERIWSNDDVEWIDYIEWVKDVIKHKAKK